jgi:hypothetical protein
LAKEINNEILWSSNTNTSKILTKFAEGMSCKIYDSHDKYTSVFLGSDTWRVISKSALHCRNDGKENQGRPKFLRVRTVSITNGFMTCSCMRYVQMLFPCTHMAHVFASIDKTFDANHFHIRYWKHFVYYGDRQWSTVAEFRDIDRIIQEIQSNCYFRDTGLYKGVHVGNNFVTDVGDKLIVTPETNHLRIKLTRMYAVIQDVGYLVSNSEQHELCMDVNQRFSITTSSHNEPHYEEFGGMSLTLGSSSQYNDGLECHDTNVTFNADDDATIVDDDVKRSRLYPKFLRFMETINSHNELDDAEAALDILIAKGNKSKTRKEALDVFNDDGAVGRMEKRHKRYYEH